ncbi:MAG: methylated-DNA--[protein]-cysteine S-methyltransferase [Aquirufa sp.]
MSFNYSIKNPLTFLSIQQMNVEEIPQLSILFSTIDSQFGPLIVASTLKGICYLAYLEETESPTESLKNQFPKAEIRPGKDKYQENVQRFFDGKNDLEEPIQLHLKASEFQWKVWNALLEIPMGKLSHYGKIANQIQQEKAARAVGTAIGSNPIAFLIPCHRVIQSSGKLGGYRWGLKRKAAIIAWEANVAF